MSQAAETFDQWAIVELMGHVRVAGRVTEEERFGAKLGRVDIPTGDGFTTQYFGGGSVYRLTPVSEEIAKGVALRNQPEPVHRWELPAPKLAAEVPPMEHGYDPYNDDDDETYDEEYDQMGESVAMNDEGYLSPEQVATAMEALEDAGYVERVDREDLQSN